MRRDYIIRGPVEGRWAMAGCITREDPMESARRSFLSSLVVTFVRVRSLLAESRQRQSLPGLPQTPDASSSGRPGDYSPVFPPPDPKLQLKENQKKIRSDADHLLELAQGLKQEADKTEQIDVLSLSLIRKAEEIEKLAKQIKGLARAS